LTGLQLYKFIYENELEIDWRGDELVLWIEFYYIEEFTELIGEYYLSEGGIEVNLRHDGIALDIVDLCEYFDIDPEDILEKNE